MKFLNGCVILLSTHNLSVSYPWEGEMAGWHHWLDGHESEWTPGVGDGQGGLACCDSWGCRVGHDWANELNWTELNWTAVFDREFERTKTSWNPS